MSRDALSDVLGAVRLRGAVFFHVSGHRTWAAEAPPASQFAARMLRGVEHVMEYHAVVEGSCWAGLPGEPAVQLCAGDAVMFPHGDAHVVSSAPGLRGNPAVAWLSGVGADQLPLRVAYSGTDALAAPPPGLSADATIVCGFLGCDLQPFNPLIDALPRLLHLRGSGDPGWIALSMHRALVESQARRPGGEALLARLSEMLFVDAVRRHAEQLPADSAGWLAGLRDRFVGRALGLMHDAPARAWTLEGLGREVGLSRSALHERFVERVGLPPMQYLAQWRMQAAARLLLETHAPVAAIALDVGYDSEAAFARAFKRRVGKPPAAWRRDRDAARA